jgi:hypothetical protein
MADKVDGAREVSSAVGSATTSVDWERRDDSMLFWNELSAGRADEQQRAVNGRRRVEESIVVLLM